MLHSLKSLDFVLWSERVFPRTPGS
jgi:hypothetical protein